MKTTTVKWIGYGFLLLIALQVLAACSNITLPGRQRQTPTPVATSTPTATPTAVPTTAPTATPTQALCPQATPEYFDVYPVTSPTGQLSQVVSVELGNGETITITTESGTFTAPVELFPTEIEIPLLPNTTHNLTVEGKVREVQQGDCTYGGYVLTTTRDRDGQPLVIEQRQP